MPGVPSGRACEGCRKQRKKCNQERPSCSRCIRLHMICVGSGQQRYQFKEQLGFRNSPEKERIREKCPSYEKENALVEVPRALNHELNVLANSFVGTIKPSTSLKFNLAWSYGTFLEEIPRRLGKNEALDAAVGALTFAHSSWCSHRVVSIEALSKYSLALKKLRVCLDDPVKARSSETLCAVMILLMCQMFVGVSGRFTGHCEGAAQIIKARGRYYDSQDDFECQLLLSLRGPVLFEGLFNNKIQFTASEWKTLVENEIDSATMEGKMLRCLARVPDFMRRGRKTLNGGGEDPGLLEDTRANYEKFKVSLSELYQPLAKVRGLKCDRSSEFSPILQALAICERSYAIGLTIGIILSSVLSAIDPGDTKLPSESTYFSKEILTLVESADMYRPVGAGYMALCLVAAWVGTTDPSIRVLAEGALAEYQRDLPPGHALADIASLERTFQHLHLVDSDIVTRYT